MSYYTTVKVVNKNGESVKAAVSCGGKPRGFTDERTGELSFDMSSNTSFGVSVKRAGVSATGSVKGGGTITLRLNK